jgi:O-antigen/teichoic acid export membrane protein
MSALARTASPTSGGCRASATTTTQTAAIKTDFGMFDTIRKSIARFAGKPEAPTTEGIGASASYSTSPKMIVILSQIDVADRL